ncbi:acetylcholine receptor subunit beta-like 2 [Eurytemora carolleeae]|uniref:acetylcholine receptor subunit beta-like 2 n=1 Tax=Eurytemora carolleeae TaxID=1294199 RepID=UPI000C769173|nr:acetylcholine receptor subunit beta-like 2 [Eurytemora carolleeae]|eukprot:XP_023345770.1 acetylcholine receptor subunit beta-like 2 [Eurytemora affinis]
MLFKTVLVCLICVCTGNPDAKKLYDDLLHNYNRLIRPVFNFTDTLVVKLGLKLSQLIDVDLKNQVMTTNVWVDQTWMDYKLQWNPEDYGGVETLYVPSERIWLPDIVLYNNADGTYEVRLMTKAELKYTGHVKWTPPAIYKSSCQINVEWFPFDEQSCDMKFGSWTYDGNQVDLKHMHQEPGNNVVDIGIDLTEFYLSVEWDILEVPATKNVENFAELEREAYIKAEYPDKLLTDITFILTMRRKTLFYTVNLIIPCVGISFLTVLVFYLPSDSGEKVTLCISILLSLTVFFLLLAEIIPPTSLAVPLLGKYLVFTMMLVTLSICVTVTILNIHFRTPATHNMPGWMKQIFLKFLPRILMMRNSLHTFFSNRKILSVTKKCILRKLVKTI